MTKETVDLAQAEDGRWRWRPHEPEPGDDQPAWSLLAFKTADEADADSVLHATAARDATGRRVMAKDYLRRLVSAIALPCAACADVYFGGVYWHRRDVAGANWGVAIMNGHGDRAGCTECVRAAKDDLRRRFSVVDEA